VTVDEIELVGRLRDAEPLRAEAFSQARATLRAAMATPAPAPRRHPRRRAWAFWSAAGTGIAAAAAAIALVAAPAAPVARTRPPAGHPAAAHAANTPLLQLAAYISGSGHPAGNATLVIRTQTYPNGQSDGGADLYTDSGHYYWAPTKSGLPAQIAAHNDLANGGFAREVAAAVYAVHGNLSVARNRMAYAMLGHRGVSRPASWTPSAAQKIAAGKLGVKLPHVVKAGGPLSAWQIDNLIWVNSVDAFAAGSGNPLVRAGVLRILSTVPEVTVTRTTAHGQPALTLTAKAPAMPTNYQEKLTINASTGVPIGLVGGAPGQTPGVTVTYQVSRVRVSRTGKF
jgi:hypothetical protein